MQISLRSARINANLSQEQLAKKLGVHRQTIKNWEKNPAKLTIEKAESICEVLNVNMSDIFFGTNLHNVDV